MQGRGTEGRQQGEEEAQQESKELDVRVGLRVWGRGVLGESLASAPQVSSHPLDGFLLTSRFMHRWAGFLVCK